MGEGRPAFFEVSGKRLCSHVQARLPVPCGCDDFGFGFGFGAPGSACSALIAHTSKKILLLLSTFRSLLTHIYFSPNHHPPDPF